MKQRSLPLSAKFGIVRTACAEDVERLVQLVAKLAAHHGDKATLTPEALSQELFSTDGWLHILVAEMEKNLIGFAALSGFIHLPFIARGMDMNSLFVEDSVRRLGVGTDLVDACKIQASSLNCRYLTVGTHPDNQEAQAFYTALGFERRDAFPPRFFVELLE